MLFKNTLTMMTHNSNSRSQYNPQPFLNRFWLLLAALSVAAAALPAYAVTRDITISAPATVVAGSKITVTVGASTDAGSGEKIGFFHADYSTDGGLTWTAISYAANAGSKTSRTATFNVKAADSKAMIRVRVAYRGGKAGDVDYAGKPIVWAGSWGQWQEPPAKIATIAVVAK